MVLTKDRETWWIRACGREVFEVADDCLGQDEELARGRTSTSPVVTTRSCKPVE
jgi:hypothetical protein